MQHHQKVKINNNCTIKYKPDHIYVTNKILEKVPYKYLEGLEEINFYDDRKGPIKYIEGKPFSKPSRIDIFMGGVAPSGKYSLIYFNFIINPTIVEHIVDYLQPKSKDNEILSYRRGRYDPKWLYLGIWSPLLIPINFSSFLYKKFAWLRSFLDARIKQFLDKNSKNNTQQ